jgi:hypothetical protein
MLRTPLSDMFAACSVLTPYQHYFRAVTGSLVAYLLFVQGLNRRTLTTVLLSAGLMASQVGPHSCMPVDSVAPCKILPPCSGSIGTLLHHAPTQAVTCAPH